MTETGIHLEISQQKTPSGLRYQQLTLELTRGDRGNLIPVAVIYSHLEPGQTIHQEQPYLEITCGPWARGGATAVPDLLMERVKGLLGTSALS
jgi:hypothetical protein